MVLEGVGRFALISGGLTALALLLDLIGFAAPNWIDSAFANSGLWRACILSVCVSVSANTDWFRAVQAFEVLGFLALIGVVVLIVLKWFVMKEQKILVILTFIGNFAAAGLILLGVIIWGAEVGSSFGFSFYLCIIAALISMAAGALMFLDYRGTTTMNT